MGNAGANTSKRQSSGKARAGSADLTGAYRVVKCGVKCTAETDPGKHAIWQHVWTSASFEEFFAKAPKAEVTKTGRKITARSEIKWALDSEWIEKVVAE